MSFSLTFVSERVPEALVSDGELRALIEVARRRNLALDVTGALIATPRYFAQILEGPRGAVDQLMRSIARDRRHRNVTVLDAAEIEHRRFRAWTVPYRGYASYVNRHIEPLIADPAGAGSGLALRRLTDLLLEFSRAE